MTMNDINSIAQELLQNEGFLTSLSQNTVFVSGLSQNKDFVSSISKNQIFKQSLLKDPEYITEIQGIIKDKLDTSFDARLAVSELRPIKRIAKLEQVTGIEEYFEDEEHELTIPERIQGLEDKIESCNFRPSESPAIEIKQKTKTGKRAMSLIKALMKSKKGHLTHAEIRDALSDEKLEDARITENTSNPRREIIDALKEAGKICSKVIPDKKGYGRHEWRLLLRS